MSLHNSNLSRKGYSIWLHPFPPRLITFSELVLNQTRPWMSGNVKCAASCHMQVKLVNHTAIFPPTSSRSINTICNFRRHLSLAASTCALHLSKRWQKRWEGHLALSCQADNLPLLWFSYILSVTPLDKSKGPTVPSCIFWT